MASCPGQSFVHLSGTQTASPLSPGQESLTDLSLGDPPLGRHLTASGRETPRITPGAGNNQHPWVSRVAHRSGLLTVGRHEFSRYRDKRIPGEASPSRSTSESTWVADAQRISQNPCSGAEPDDEKV